MGQVYVKRIDGETKTFEKRPETLESLGEKLRATRKRSKARSVALRQLHRAHEVTLRKLELYSSKLLDAAARRSEAEKESAWVRSLLTRTAAPSVNLGAIRAQSFAIGLAVGAFIGGMVGSVMHNLGAF